MSMMALALAESVLASESPRTFLVNPGNLRILAEAVRDLTLRVTQLEHVVCYTESGVDMPEDLRLVQDELFKRFPFGSLPGDVK
jgi:hypothetical protein